MASAVFVTSLYFLYTLAVFCHSSTIDTGSMEDVTVGNWTDVSNSSASSESEVLTDNNLHLKRREWALSKYLLEVLKQTAPSEKKDGTDSSVRGYGGMSFPFPGANRKSPNVTMDISYVESLVEKIKVLEESLQELNASWDQRLAKLESRLEVLEQHPTASGITEKCPPVLLLDHNLIARVGNETYIGPTGIPQEMAHLTTINFSCRNTNRHIFRLSGQPNMTCYSGNWIGKVPSCKLYISGGKNRKTNWNINS